MRTDLRTHKNPAPARGLTATHARVARAGAGLPDLESLAAEAIRRARIAAALHMYEAAGDPAGSELASEATSLDLDVLTVGRFL